MNYYPNSNMKNVLDKSSMLYWWPKIKQLGNSIPMPQTEIIRLDGYVYTHAFDVFLAEHGDIAEKTAAKIGYPLFLRTDHVSGKHDWQNTCFVENADFLIGNIYNVVQFSEVVDMLGLPVRAIVFREYVEMASIFTAFTGSMPVNPERRYLFVMVKSFAIMLIGLKMLSKKAHQKVSCQRTGNSFLKGLILNLIKKSVF